MEYSAVYHESNKNFCYALDKGLFLFRIQVKKDDVESITLHYKDKYIPLSFMDTRASKPMHYAVSDRYHDFFEVELSFDVICLRYFFEIKDKQGNITFYGNHEFFDEKIEGNEKMFDCPQNLREEEMFLVPEWAKNKVVYQIFPSRFSSSKEVPDKLWYKAPISFLDDLKGDIRGIIHRLDHLVELGIDVIYLTPIFTSTSCHKYDTVDYYKIDPSFGTKEDLKELVELAHQRGLRVILDGVFNHTSQDFFAFADIVEKQEKSKYLDWYFIEGFPLQMKMWTKPNFKTFSYFGGMPKLNIRNPEVEEYFINVACYWIRECDIDGWRLDVADEIGHRFWKHFREAVKQVKPDALIVGEVWHFAADFLEGDEWDSIMNYHFFNAVMNFVANERITASQFMQQLDFVRGKAHKNVYPILWNLIDSHDTARFLHSCGNSVKKQRLGAAFQLLMPGMPMIYYGDEYAMKGGPDPDCRRGMVWKEDHQNSKMFAWYQNLIRLRKEYSGITEGETTFCETQDETGLIILGKKLGEEELTLIFHGKKEPLELTRFKGQRNLITQKPFSGKIAGYDVAVLQKTSAI